MTIGFDQPLYILPFDQRESFQTKMFGWEGRLSAAQTAEIAAAKQDLRRLLARLRREHARTAGAVCDGREAGHD